MQKKNFIYLLFICGSFSLSAQVKTEIEGALKIGNTSLLDDGIIRFTGTDFEGRSNGMWMSLTNSNSPTTTNWTLIGSHIYNNNGGNVGIGTTNPSREFHIENGDLLVNKPGGSSGSIFITGPDGMPGLVFYGNSPENYRAEIRRATNGLSFDVGPGTSNPTSKMYIGNSGNVGIGTFTPPQRLSVIGTIRASYILNSAEFVEMTHGGTNGFINSVGDGDLDFRHDGVTLMSLTDNGKVVIGEPTTPGNFKLYVDGGILAERVKIALSSSSDWADDAFDKTPTLEDVKSSIEDQSHLKEMPSVDFLLEHGYDLQDMDAKLLQQIEWLWIHMIDMKKENDALKERIAELEGKK